MPRTPEIKSYTRNGANYLRVFLGGRYHALGRADDPQARARGLVLIADYLRQGRPKRFEPEPDRHTEPGEPVALITAIADFLEDARGRVHPSRYYNFERALKLLSPWAMRDLREFRAEQMVEVRDVHLRRLEHQRGGSLSHQTLCDYWAIIKQFSAWAVDRRRRYSVPAEWATFSTMRMGRRRGESRPRRHVEAVSQADIDATLPLLPEPLRNLLRVQEATGRRTGELVALRACDINRNQTPWTARLARHKTADSTGQDLTIMFGPQARALLLPIIEGAEAPQALLFPNARGRAYTSSAVRQEAQKACAYATWQRWDINTRRTWSASYVEAGGKLPTRFNEQTSRHRDAILPIVRHAMQHGEGVIWWHPHQLRHNAAQRAEAAADVTAAKAMLGNRTLSATAVYRRKAEAAQAEIVERVG